MGVKDLAARIGGSTRSVSVRLRLLELPAAARRLVDDGTWSLEDAGAAAKLADHPDALAELVDRQPPDVAWAVKVALEGLDRQHKAESLLAQAEAAGVAVVDDEGYSPRSYRPLAGHGGLGLDAEAHAGEPCHAVVIPARSPAMVAVCTEPRRHAARGESEHKAPGAADGEADRVAERQRRAAERCADEARGAFLEELVGSRVRKADTVSVVCCR